MPILTILLDSNEYIFGLSKQLKSSVGLLNLLSSFNIRLPRFVLDELHANLNQAKLKALYRLIKKLKIEIVEEKVPATLVEKYQQYLPLEDSVIAAYCEFLSVDWLISENRHFLVDFDPKKFKVVSAESFINQYKII